MDFNRTWTRFAVDAEIDYYGSERIVRAHNDARARIAELTARVAELEARLAEEIKWGHRNCTGDNCRSSGTDCPANTENPHAAS